MRRRKIVAAGFALLALGGAFFSLSTLKEPRPGWATSFPSWIFDGVLIVGALALVVGLLLLASTVIYVPYLSKWQLDCRAANRKELKVLHDFSEEHFPGSISLNETKRLHRLNPDMFIAVWRESEKLLSYGYDSKILGFFSIIPVNGDAKELLEKGLFKGEHWTGKYILGKRAGAAAIYLGGIAARKQDMGQVLAYLIIAMFKVVAAGHRELYTRPTTKRGLKLAKQYGFLPVAAAGLDQIYRLEFDLLDDRVADPERARRVINKIREKRGF